MKPLVTAIIPCYNYASYVPKAIDSVLAQTYPNVECIVVDDGSTDEIRDVLAGYGDRIRAIHQENRGLPGARNRGIQEGRGDYFAFLDADDYWFPTKLERQMAVFERNPEAGLVHGRAQITDLETGEVTHDLTPELRGDVFPILFRQPQIRGSASCAVVPRRVIDAVGLFAEHLTSAEDYDMWIRIAARFPVDFPDDTEPLVCIRRHGDSMRHQILRSLDNWLQVYERMWNLPDRPPLDRAAVDHEIEKRFHRNAILLYKQRAFPDFRRLVWRSLGHSGYLLRQRDILVALVKSLLGRTVVETLRGYRLSLHDATRRG